MASEQNGGKGSKRGRRLLLLGCGLAALASFLVWRQQSPGETRPGDNASVAETSDQVAPSAASPPNEGGSKASFVADARFDPETARLVKELLDSTQPLKARRERARNLARLGTDSAIGALRAVLQNGDAPPY